jgi:hypothetical protein
MASSTLQPRGHYRGKPRTGRRVAVRYRAGDHPDEETAVTKNIGIGGAFVLCTPPAPPGTRLLLVFELAGGGALEVAGEVRWTIDGRHGEAADEHGMGIKFSGLDVEQLIALNEFLAAHPHTVDHDES